MRYHLVSALSALAATLLASLAKPFSPRWDDMRIKHSWNAVPENWEGLGNPLSGTTIDLYIALKAHHENALIDTLYQEQVADLVSPPPGTLELIHSWLEYHGVPSSSVSMTHGGTTLTLSGVSIIQANALLGASYQLYMHVETNETVVRTVGYALPAALHGLVQTVVPTTCFSTPHTQWQSPRRRPGRATAGLKRPVSESGEPVTVLSSRDDDDTTPSFLRSLYKTAEYTPAAADRNALGIVGMLNGYPSPEDLATFMSVYRSDGTNAAITVVQVNGGGYDPTNPAREPNLDTQYATAMAYPTPVIFYSTGRGPAGTTDWFASWLRYILTEGNIGNIPRTISISYVADEKGIPVAYTMYMCTHFGILGALGVSVLIATGDDGVGRGDCMADDGSVRFIPLWPATCPYVTAIGGTTNHNPEIAASISGGGFSDHFRRPVYQDQAVGEFLQHLGNQYQGQYNATSRGIPDISAQALRFPIILKGERRVMSGTSGSAPIVAGMISLLNDYLISQGKVTLGFLNPWLYGTGLSGLTDITSGSNPGCNTDGFSAIEGWDPVTGLGTPDFQRLLPILPDHAGPGGVG
ncbi:subtilisin-like protein [Lactarius sanguifluus]|nr:subtilisin-like protein [Lactarius sanguifluus]